MRRWWCAAALLSVAALAPEREEELLVTGIAFDEDPDAVAGAALAALLAGALRAAGSRARAAPPPGACASPHAPDAPACLRAVLGALARGTLHAALVPGAPGALPAPGRLREAGLESWGALEPGGGGAEARRACWTRGALRSLAELAEPATARLYRLAPESAAALSSASGYFCDAGDEKPRAEPCAGALATALVGPEDEARALLRAARAAALPLQALALGAAWSPREALRAHALVCGRGAAPPGARALGPPPCAAAPCAWDARPLLKLGNARRLARAPAASRALDRLALAPGGARALATRARAAGPEAAAREALAAAPGGEASAREVRVAVLAPLSTRREAAPAHALAAAARLAEEDEAEAEGEREGVVRYKVELVDSGCAASRAFKYLTDALGAEFHALSGAAGPACAGAWGAVSRQSAALALPLLAYTAQTAAPGALLTAGSAAASLPALTALLAALGWRRLALLSEAGGRAALDVARLGVDVLVHVELPEGEELAEDLIEEWAWRAADANARVLLLLVEDARAVRAALQASARRGLTAQRGAAVLLAPGAAWSWRRAWGGEGHLRLAPEWATRWESAPDARWSRRLRLPRGEAAPPSAALLYDALRLWARALRGLLRAHPEALDDLHREDRVRSLLEDCTRTPYSGLTGAFHWEGLARDGPLLVQQWRGERYEPAGRWVAGALQLDAGALRWSTPDGRAPGDGAEPCARRPLARDCRAGALGALAGALALLLALLGAGAWACRRRAAREHRARLAAFGMRALGPAAPGRWELPRERVVINRRLGAGACGAVYGGHALLGGGRGWAAVAVKTLRAGASAEEKLDFLSEAEAMKRFSHECVVRLLGVVTRSEPVCTVMEYALHGDLKGYLLARRHLARAPEVAPVRLTAMARDAARGLAYLARMRFVHRDVAARNCLVDAALRVKLADFGMTRVAFENDYYRFGRRGLLPVRWMAPESLALGVFSSASDVWSFGVLLYEMVTFGALPYRGLSNAEVLRRARAHRPPPLPPLEPQLEALIRSCWRRSRRARPTAAALAEMLAQRPRLLAPSLAPPDALDEPLPSRDATARPERDHWSSWTTEVEAESESEAEAETHAGTDTTYLSAPPTPPLTPPPSPPPTPPDCEPFLPPATH